MDAAAARLADAVQRNEKIAIFGDYDVDGATSSALLICSKVAAKAGFSFNKTISTPLGNEPQIVQLPALELATAD